MEKQAKHYQVKHPYVKCKRVKIEFLSAYFITEKTYTLLMNLSGLPLIINYVNNYTSTVLTIGPHVFHTVHWYNARRENTARIYHLLLQIEEYFLVTCLSFLLCSIHFYSLFKSHHFGFRVYIFKNEQRSEPL